MAVLLVVPYGSGDKYLTFESENGFSFSDFSKLLVSFLTNRSLFSVSVYYFFPTK